MRNFRLGFDDSNLDKCLDFGIAGEDYAPLLAEKAHARKADACSSLRTRLTG